MSHECISPHICINKYGKYIKEVVYVTEEKEQYRLPRWGDTKSGRIVLTTISNDMNNSVRAKADVSKISAKLFLF